MHYSVSLSRLVAVITSSESYIYSKVEIFTLDFPPLKEAVAYTAHPLPSSSRFTPMAIGFLLALAVLSIFAYLRMKKKSPEAEKLDATAEKMPPPEAEDRKSTAEKMPLPETTFYQRHTNSIIFFGGFRVFDKAGNDITERFSPTLKYLLILLIVYTHKNPKGISSVKLEELLWHSKSDQAARNNRNVNFHKLRKLLEAVGDFEIKSKNNHWAISLGETISSDYLEIFRLIAQINDSGSTPDAGCLMRLTELLAHGDILPNTQTEWIDSFKSDFADKILDVLFRALNANMVEPLAEKSAILLRIADTIFIFDSINETALAVKCQLLYQSDKTGLAQKVYNNFVKNYKLLLDENYQTTFKDVLKKR